MKTDFLGHVRVRVDRNKPLHSCLEVYLDGSEAEVEAYDQSIFAEKGDEVWPAGSLGQLHLFGDELHLLPRTAAPRVSECLSE